MALRYSKTWFLSSEIRQGLLNFVDKTKKHSVLEIGCYEGLSSVCFAENLLNDPESSLVCVDPFMSLSDNDHKEYLTNNEEANFDYNISICKNSEKVTVHKVTSDSFFETNTRTYDFIYIDGCHEPDFIWRDMENSFRVLEKNGVMWMDDYGGGDGIQIRKTMDEFLDKYAGQYTLLHRGYQLAIKKCKIKLVDCFIFYNELGMLKYRLELLYPYVDQFIICESTLTFSGNQKPLYYQENKHLYEKYADKIIHVIVDDMPVSTNAWDREKHQRRSISRGFKDLSASDIIILSDLDEIPNPAILDKVRVSGIDALYSLKQDFYYYNLTTFVGDNWSRSKIFPYSFLKSNDLELCRMTSGNVFTNGGWHLSYFGDEKFISNKIKNFSHQEYNSDKYTDETSIAERLKIGMNIFDDRILEHVPLEKNTNLPPNYKFLIECMVSAESQVREAILCPANEFVFMEDYLNAVLPGLFVFKYDPAIEGTFASDCTYWCIRRVPFNKLLPGTRINFINTEQLTVPWKYQEFKTFLRDDVEVYDYSLANIQVSGVGRYLPYKEVPEEISRLKEHLAQEKEYDFALIGTPSEHRTKIVNTITSKGYTINYIHGWKDKRDKEVGKCRYLLNLHFRSEYTVYESIRCERWRMAGMTIYSEASVDLPEGVLDIATIPFNENQLLISP